MSQLEMLWIPDHRPEYTMPDGFDMVTITKPEQGHLWIEAGIGLTGDPWSQEAFEERMPGDVRVGYSGRMFVAVDRANGLGVATASCRIPEDHGYCTLHMVSSRPEYRGKHLGRATSAAALQKLIDEKVDRIFLTTDDFRLPAITMYLSFGFLPTLYEEDMASRWNAIMYGFGKSTYRAFDKDKKTILEIPVTKPEAN